MTIPAIETSYDGHRFRSRLEARWAIFFNQLKVRYQYEAQGYLVGERQRPYLPDFYLPTLQVWAEVKGDPAAVDTKLLSDAVNAKSGLPGADPFGELAILILGEIPPPGGAYLHWLVSRSVFADCGQLCACTDARYSQITFQSFPQAAVDEFARLHPEYRDHLPEPPGGQLVQIGRALLKPDDSDLLRPRPCRWLVPDLRVVDAFRAARSARFEHGETAA